MAETGKKITPRDILRIVFRRWRMFFGSAILFAITVLVAAHYMPVRYSGVTKFERRVDPSGLEGKSDEVESWQRRRHMLYWDMSGPHALTQAAEELDLFRGMPHGPDGQLTDRGQAQKQELIEKLRRSVGIGWDVNTWAIDLISVSVTHEDPVLAQKLPDTLVKNYINRLGEQMIQSLKSSKEFLEAQTKAASELLQQQERKRIDFETKHYNAMFTEPGSLLRVIDENKLQIEMLERQYEIVRMKLTAVEAADEALRAGRRPTTQPAGATIEGQPTTQPALLSGAPAPTTQPGLLAGPGTTTQPAEPETGGVKPPLGMVAKVVVKPNPNFLTLLNELENLRETLTRSLLRMKPAHPTVKELETRIQQTIDRIQQMKVKGEDVVQEIVYDPTINPIERRMLEQERDVTDGQLMRLRAKLANYESSLANFEKIKQEYERIQKQIKQSEAELAAWNGRLDNVKAALAGEIAKRRNIIATVQAAEKQSRPSDPSLFKILGMATAGGLLLGAALVFLAHMMDRSISTPEDAKNFGVPIHGIIGEIITRQRRRNLRMRRWLLSPVVVLVVLIALGGSAFSLTLWLKAPDEYKRFQSARLEYLQDQVISNIQRVIDKIY